MTPVETLGTVSPFRNKITAFWAMQLKKTIDVTSITSMPKEVKIYLGHPVAQGSLQNR